MSIKVKVENFDTKFIKYINIKGNYFYYSFIYIKKKLGMNKLHRYPYQFKR